jgi:hypothetical protein
MKIPALAAGVVRHPACWSLAAALPRGLVALRDYEDGELMAHPHIVACRAPKYHWSFCGKDDAAGKVIYRCCPASQQCDKAGGGCK